MKINLTILLFFVFLNLVKSQNYTFTKKVVVGNLGCNINTSTTISHDGQFDNIDLPFAKGIKVYNLNCEHCVTDSTSFEYNNLQVKSNFVSFDLKTNCEETFTQEYISEDSIFTLTNSHKETNWFEDYDKIKGYGSNNSFTHFEFTISVHPNFEIISVKENSPDYDFTFNGNEITFKAKDISDFLYQVQFRRKPLNLTYNKEKIKVKSDSISIDIYDSSLEDGDIINLFYGKKIILQNYFARNEKKRIYLKLLEGETLTIENVDEGKIIPNTVVLIINDGHKKQKLEISTSKTTAQVLYFVVKR